MSNKGFTLVEILIVVVILGILAAIVIPQFTGASTEAKESALVSDLQSMRSQIELFKVQHNADILPGEIVASDGTISTATAVSFVNAMCYRTDKDGTPDTAGTGLAATYRFGPYMKKLPENPFSACPSTTVTVAGLSEGPSSVVVGGSPLTSGGVASGWYLVISDAKKGEFQAADALANPTDATNLHVNY